jgi:hypothetical protein
LLREAEKLIGLKIHPQTIVEGYRIASAAALKALEEAAVDHGYVVALREVVTFCFLTTLISSYIKVRCCDVPERPDEYCSDDAFVKGVGSGQGLLCKPRRRRRLTVESERAPSGWVYPIAFYSCYRRDRRTWIIFRSSKKSAES